MVNPFQEVNWRPGLVERRKFAVSLMIGFPCLAVIMLLGRRLLAHQWRFVPAMELAGGGFGAGLFFWTIPTVALPFYWVWYFLSCCIGIILGNFLLMLFFYTIVTATGAVLRLLGRTPISKRIDKKAASYWQDAEPSPAAERYFRQF